MRLHTHAISLQHSRAGARVLILIFDLGAVGFREKKTLISIIVNEEENFSIKRSRRVLAVQILYL